MEKSTSKVNQKIKGKGKKRKKIGQIQSELGEILNNSTKNSGKSNSTKNRGESIKPINNDKLSEYKKKFESLPERKIIIGTTFYIRHGKTEDDGSLQSNEKEIMEDQKPQIKKIGEFLKKLGINNENSILSYCEDTKRSIQTANIINFVMNTKKEITDILKTSDKTENNRAIRLIDAISGIVKENRNYIMENYGIILINIVHKTNLCEINAVIKEEIGDKIEYSSDDIEPLGIVLLNFNIKGDIVDYEFNKDILTLFSYSKPFIINVSDNHLNSIINILGDNEEFEQLIKSFNEGQIDIFNLQNSINLVFEENKELYLKYIYNEENNIDLSIFCITSIINKKLYQDENHLTTILEKLLIKYVSEKEQKTILTSLLLNSSSEIINIFFKIFNKDIIESSVKEIIDKKTLQKKSFYSKNEKNNEYGKIITQILLNNYKLKNGINEEENYQKLIISIAQENFELATVLYKFIPDKFKINENFNVILIIGIFKINKDASYKFQKQFYENKIM